MCACNTGLPVSVALPTEPLKDGCNPALIGGADLGLVEVEGDLVDGEAVLPVEPRGDDFFPSIGLESRLLFKVNMLPLEDARRP